MIKTVSKKKECKKAKWLSEETLQIAEKRREAKSKGEKERYTLLNAEFQRIARRDRKAFLSNQCKEIEEKKTKYCPSKTKPKKTKRKKGKKPDTIFNNYIPLVSLIFLKKSLVFPILLLSSISLL